MSSEQILKPISTKDQPDLSVEVVEDRLAPARKVGKLANVISLINQFARNKKDTHVTIVKDNTTTQSLPKSKSEKKSKKPIDIIAGTVATLAFGGLSAMSALDAAQLNSTLQETGTKKASAQIELTQSLADIEQSNVGLTEYNESTVAESISQSRGIERPNPYATSQAKFDTAKASLDQITSDPTIRQLLVDSGKYEGDKSKFSPEQLAADTKFNSALEEFRTAQYGLESAKAQPTESLPQSLDMTTVTKAEADQALKDVMGRDIAEGNFAPYMGVKDIVQKREEAKTRNQTAKDYLKQAETFNAPEITNRRDSAQNTGKLTGLAAMFGAAVAGLGIKKTIKESKRQIIQIPDSPQPTEDLSKILQPQTEPNQSSSSQEISNSINSDKPLSPQMQKLILEKYFSSKPDSNQKSINPQLEKNLFDAEIKTQRNLLNQLDPTYLLKLSPQLQREILSKISNNPETNVLASSSRVFNRINNVSNKGIESGKKLFNNISNNFNKWWRGDLAELSRDDSQPSQESIQIIDTSPEEPINTDLISTTPSWFTSTYNKAVGMLNNSSRSNIIRSTAAIGSAVMLGSAAANIGMLEGEIRGMESNRANTIEQINNTKTQQEKQKEDFMQFQKENAKQLREMPIVSDSQMLELMKEAKIDTSKVQITNRPSDQIVNLSDVQKKYLIGLYQQLATDQQNNQFGEGLKAPELDPKVKAITNEIAQKTPTIQAEIDTQKSQLPDKLYAALGLNVVTNAALSLIQLYKRRKEKPNPNPNDEVADSIE